MNLRPRNPLPLIVALAMMLLAPALAPGAAFQLSENAQRGAQPFAPAPRRRNGRDPEQPDEHVSPARDQPAGLPDAAPGQPARHAD
jgi:hypothetical protein